MAFGRVVRECPSTVETSCLRRRTLCWVLISSLTFSAYNMVIKYLGRIVVVFVAFVVQVQTVVSFSCEYLVTLNEQSNYGANSLTGEAV